MELSGRVCKRGAWFPPARGTHAGTGQRGRTPVLMYPEAACGVRAGASVRAHGLTRKCSSRFNSLGFAAWFTGLVRPSNSVIVMRTSGAS